MPAARWDALAADLHRAGLTGAVTAVSFPGGVSYEITIPVDGEHLVRVLDAYDRHDRWRGYQAWVEDGGAIVVAQFGPSRRRAEVVRWMAEQARLAVAR